MPKFRTNPGVLVSLLWLLLASQILRAQPAPLVTLDSAGTTSIDDNFLLFAVDSEVHDGGGSGPRDAMDKDRAGAFSRPKSGSLNAGYSPATYWIKLKLLNPGPEKDYFLVAAMPYMQLAAWRLVDDDALSQAATDPELAGTIPLQLERATPTVYYVRVRTPYIADLQFHVMDRKQLNNRNQQQLVFASIMAGCFLAMIIYNLFLFVSLRDRHYFYYLLFALVNSHLNLTAVNFPPGIDHWLGWNWWAIFPYYVPMAPMVTFVFARSFLQTRVKNPKLDSILLIYMGGLLVFVLAAPFVPPWTHLNSLSAYMLLGIFLLLLAGFRTTMQGYQPARYFLAGIGTFLIGILLLLLRDSGFLPSSFVTNNAHLLAQASEMMLMSMALGHRIKLLEDAKTRAEVTAEVKSRLLRIISHDIVTPLTVVKATAWHLRKEVEDPARVDRVVRAASIIEDIVGFIRKKEMMESGEIMQLGPVALKAVFDELAFLFQDRAQEKNISLHFQLEHPDLAVTAEPVSLSNEVLGNLISNAIKFSHPGSPVHIRASRTRNGRVKITIQDEGIGMDGGTVSRLFDSSLKQSRQGTQGEKGIGFGMPLAKAYIDAYGGEIEATSQTEDGHVQRGTTLAIILDAADEPKSRS